METLLRRYHFTFWLKYVFRLNFSSANCHGKRRKLKSSNLLCRNSAYVWGHPTKVGLHSSRSVFDSAAREHLLRGIVWLHISDTSDDKRTTDLPTSLCFIPWTVLQVVIYQLTGRFIITFALVVLVLQSSGAKMCLFFCFLRSVFLYLLNFLGCVAFFKYFSE